MSCPNEEGDLQGIGDYSSDTFEGDPMTSFIVQTRAVDPSRAVEVAAIDSDIAVRNGESD